MKKIIVTRENFGQLLKEKDAYLISDTDSVLKYVNDDRTEEYWFNIPEDSSYPLSIGATIEPINQ